MPRVLTLVDPRVQETLLPRCAALTLAMKMSILWMLVVVIAKGGGYKAIFGNYYGVFPQRDDGDCDIINMFSLAQHANCKK